MHGCRVSSKNVKKYLAFYADDFRTPDGESRAAWRSPVRSASANEVDTRCISDATVKFSDNSHATVKFRQSYRASHLKTSAQTC